MFSIIFSAEILADSTQKVQSCKVVAQPLKMISHVLTWQLNAEKVANHPPLPAKSNFAPKDS